LYADRSVTEHISFVLSGLNLRSDLSPNERSSPVVIRDSLFLKIGFLLLSLFAVDALGRRFSSDCEFPSFLASLSFLSARFFFFRPRRMVKLFFFLHFPKGIQVKTFRSSCEASRTNIQTFSGNDPQPRAIDFSKP